MEATSGVLDSLVSVPDGGGALKSIGERFQPDLLRGTGNYAIAIELPRGVADLRPSLSLRYSTGQGNGPFGVGWQLAGPLAISRRSDRGVPQYDARDEFVLAGSDLLVPVGGGRYRARSDTRFWMIRAEASGWTIRTKEGRRYVLGASASARVDSPFGTYCWLVEEESDPHGNAIRYRWELDQGVPYLREIEWSIFAVRLEYEPRPDPVFSGRAGFPQIIGRRCSRLERRTVTEAQPVTARYVFTYEQAEGTSLSLLAAARLEGVAADLAVEQYPPVRFTYSRLERNDRAIHRIQSTGSFPPALDRREATLVDMDGDGLPDVLETDLGGHRWWPNRGNGTFGSLRRLATAPAGMTLGRSGVTLADLDGDGAVDMLRVEPRLGMAVLNTAEGRWADRPELFSRQIPMHLTATTSRLVDLDGDGVTDLLQSTPTGLLLTYNRGADGWSQPQVVSRRSDPELFPDVDLASPDTEIADMTGDGLSDLVFLSSGRVEFWPYFGRGRWGGRVSMRNAPVLPPRYDRRRLYLADLDGDGAADLLYIDYDRVLYWLNQSGLAWSRQYEIGFIPPPGAATITLCDFLGTGAPGILWSTRPATHQDTGYRFLSLATSTKPYLLRTIDDGFGSVTEIAYTTSSALRTRDADRGEDWNSYLPFTLQVVESITKTDIATGGVARNVLRYHRGHYDGLEREFRGFERVEQETQGDAHSPTLVQESLFYQGSGGGPRQSMDQPAAQRARERALAGSLIEMRTFEIDSAGTRVQRQSATMQWDAREELAGDGLFVHFPHVTRTVAREIAAGGVERVETGEYTYDEFGNVTRKVLDARFTGSADPPLRTEQRIAYVRNEADWIVALPSSIEARGSAGQLLKHDQHFYDGPAFVGLPAGEATRGVLKRSRELVYLDDALPAGYAESIDPAWGLIRSGPGWYRDTVSYDHDARGNIIGQHDALGSARQVEYESDGVFPRRLTDPAGLATECAFDRRTAQPHELRLPDGRVTRYRYSPIGRLRAQFDTGSDGDLSLTSAFSIDYGDYAATPVRPARVVSIHPAGPNRSELEFTDGMDPGSIVDASVACDYYNSDGKLLERLVRDEDADGSPRWIAKGRRSYGAWGRPSGEYPNERRSSPAFVLPSGTASGIRFFYDGLNQVVRIDRPDGTRLGVRFLGDRIEKRDASTADDQPGQIERYDAHGQLIAVEQADGAGTTVTRYTRDDLGRVTAVHDASGRRLLAFTYGGPGSPVQLQHADAGQRTYWRDGRSSLRQRTDSLGRRLVMEYDALNRLTRALDATDAGNPVVVRSLVYDGGRLLEASEGAVRTAFTYDPAGRPARTTIELDGETIVLVREYRYDGQLAAMVYPDGTRVEFTSNRTGMPASIPGIVDRVDYDEYGSPARIAFNGGPGLEYSYDAEFRRLERAALRIGAAVVRDLTVGYDVNGNILSFVDRLPGQALSRRFTYDGLYRLTRAEVLDGVDGPVLRDDRYAYSATGDLLRKDESLIGSMTYGDALHSGRLTSFQRATAASASTVSYDEAGRVVAMDQLSNLRYDLFDRLIEVTTTDGVIVRFAYDHRGTRIRKQVVEGGQTRNTLSCENLYERSSAGTRLNIFLARLLVAARWTPAGGNAETHYLLTDHLGSILAACDSTGAIKAQQMYSPFGLPTRTATDHDRYIGFAPDGEIGLTQFGARYYCPAIGRFISPDWFVIENPNRAFRVPQGLNAYSYAINNPLALRDASGLWFGIDDLIAAAVGFVVGFVAGVIHGALNGYSFGDTLLNGLEGGLLGAVGGFLAWNTLGAAALLFSYSGALIATFSGLGIAAGILVGAAGVLVGAAAVGLFANAVMSGAMQIYDWGSWTGWLAFLVDYSWGGVGTALGGLLHVVNAFYGNRAYREDVSRRQNRHVYDGGFGFGNFAFTQGNVVSNLQGRTGDLLNHEGLHTLQSRLFGPLFQGTYIAWLIVGGALGIVIFGPIAAANGESYGEAIMDVAYRDNPWETWAYCAENPTPGGRGGMFSYAC